MPTEVKAYSKKELSGLYGVSTWVLRQWLKPFNKKIGEYCGKSYTPAQVKIIFEALGDP